MLSCACRIIDAMLLVCTEKVVVDSISSITNVQAAVNSLTLLLDTLEKCRQGIGLTDEQVCFVCITKCTLYFFSRYHWYTQL